MGRVVEPIGLRDWEVGAVGGLRAQLNGSAKLVVRVEPVVSLGLTMAHARPSTVVGSWATTRCKCVGIPFVPKVKVVGSLVRRKMGLDGRIDLTRKYFRRVGMKNVGVAQRRTADGGWISLLAGSVGIGSE